MFTKYNGCGQSPAPPTGSQVVCLHCPLLVRTAQRNAQAHTDGLQQPGTSHNTPHPAYITHTSQQAGLYRCSRR